MDRTYLIDTILALIFLGYPVVLVIISGQLKKFGATDDMTRKFVHAGMGLVVLFVPLFTHMWIVLIPPILFTIMNFIDYKFGWISQIQGEDQGNIGTVLYPISYIILILFLFDTPYWGLAIIGILSMAFGDAAASIIGRMFGGEGYLVSGEKRSVAGSMAMFIVTFGLVFIIAAITGSSMGITVRFLTLFPFSLIMAGMATAIEALSTRGSDNFTVPCLTAFIGWFVITQLLPNIEGTQTIVLQPLYQ